MEGKQKTILNLFEENELNVGILYKLYSQKITRHKFFWLKLSMEEVSHASDIHAAFRKNSETLFKETKFTRGVLRYVMDFVEEKIQEARGKKISHIEALNDALRIEQSIIEKKCFELFIPTDNKLKDVLRKLNKETEKHISILRKEFKRQ
mgnify:CR=1 FL=1